MPSGDPPRLGKPSRTERMGHNFDLRFVSGDLIGGRMTQEAVYQTVRFCESIGFHSVRRQPDEIWKPV